MREIKFRAWDSKTKEYVFNDVFLSMINGVIYGGKIADEGRFDIQLFTGLLDKNGKEIYLGDIIQWDESYVLGGGKKYKAVMEWKGQILLPHINPTSEIIGNIYEHPHLLKPSEGDIM